MRFVDLSNAYLEGAKFINCKMEGLNLSILPDIIGHSDRVFCCSYSPDGKKIATTSEDKTVKLYDSISGNCLKTLEGHSNSVNSCSYSPDGRNIATASSDRKVKIWDTKTGNCL